MTAQVAHYHRGWARVVRQAIRAAILAGTLVAHGQPTRAQSTAAVQYRAVLAPADSLLQITITLTEAVRSPAHLVMPAAIPMGYGSQPYRRFVSGLTAHDMAGAPLPLAALEGTRWLVGATGERPLRRIAYVVNLAAMERQVLSAGDASRVRPGFVGLLGYSVFAFVDGLESLPVQLSIAVPPGWSLLSTLEPARTGTGSMTVSARDFYHLADSQIMGGPDLAVRRLSSAAPLTVAVYAEGPLEIDTLAVLSDRALRAAADYFGSTPFPHFTVSLEALRPVSPDHQYRFSMEHLESATFRFEAGRVSMNGPDRTRFFYNLLHHLAHAWIPKRCAPAGYYPFVWDYPEPIDEIWFSEGWGQYAAADMLGRSDPRGDEARRALLAFRFEAAARDSGPPLGGRSVPELSRIASQRYSEEFRFAQAVFSRGAMMAAAIDDRIRRETGGRQTFREVARALLARCAADPAPVTAAGLGLLIQETTGVRVDDLIAAGLAPRGRVGAAPRSRP